MNRPTYAANVAALAPSNREIADSIRRDAKGRTCGTCSHFNGGCALDWSTVKAAYHGMQSPLILTPEAVACKRWEGK